MHLLERKGAFLWLMMLTAALVLTALLPVQEAKADLSVGSLCPECSEGTLGLYYSSGGYHWLKCSNPDCYYYGKGADTNYIFENCWGGEATCRKKAVCQGCGEEYGDFGAHRGAWTAVDETNHSRVCQDCGVMETESHTFGNWQDNGDGTHTRGCVCGRTETTEHSCIWSFVDAYTHKGVCECGAETTEAHYDRWEGWCNYQPHCEQCDHDYGSIGEHEMRYEDWGESGHKPSCKKCDEYFFLELHTYSEWQNNGNDTHSRSCICGATETEEHSFDKWQDNGDGTHTGNCVCGRTLTVEHTYTWTYVDDETCKGVCACGAEVTEAHYDRWASFCGRQPHCEKCDHDYGAIPEHEMWYEDRGESGHKPSCYHCDMYFFLEAHSYSDWKDNGDGTHTGKCVCGRTQSVAHTYTWTYVDDDTHKGVCECGTETTEAHYDRWASVCGRQPHCEKCDHDYGSIPEHEMWYEDRGENGHKPSCYHCDMYFFLEAHSFAATTCVSGPTCEKCGAEYDKPLGHDLKATARVEPTCTSTGTEAYWTCQRDGCGKQFSDAEGKNEIEEPVVIKALGHDLKATARVEPTCTESGTEAYWTCQRDGCSKLFSDAEGKNEIEAPVVIPAKGHTEVVDPAVPVTCTETGLTEGKHCSACDNVLVKQEVVPAKGHTPGTAVRENEKPATCTRSGSYDEVVYCSVCGEELSRESKQIPAWGHNYAETGHTITRIYYRCGNCGDSYWIDNSHSRSLIPDLVRDENGENVDYIAGVSRESGKRILTVTPDLQREDTLTKVTSLWLKPEYVERWLKEGVGIVRFQRDDAILEIELTEITPDWFTLDKEVETLDFYVFTLDPADDEVLVNVNAVIGEAKTPADALTGTTLKVNGTVVDVKENGTYRIVK